MLSVIMLSVIMLSVIMLSVIMLSVIMLSVTMLSVVMHAECHYPECRGAVLMQVRCESVLKGFSYQESMFANLFFFVTDDETK